MGCSNKSFRLYEHITDYFSFAIKSKRENYTFLKYIFVTLISINIIIIILVTILS